METDNLLCCLKAVTVNVANVFVVARDELGLVDFSRLPVMIAVNTDKSSEPGTHWLGCYVCVV